VFLSLLEYKCHLYQLRSSKLALNTISKNKTIKVYRMVHMFNILTINGKYKCIKPLQ